MIYLLRDHFMASIDSKQKLYDFKYGMQVLQIDLKKKLIPLTFSVHNVSLISLCLSCCQFVFMSVSLQQCCVPHLLGGLLIPLFSSPLIIFSIGTAVRRPAGLLSWYEIHHVGLGHLSPPTSLLLSLLISGNRCIDLWPPLLLGDRRTTGD